MKCIEIITLRSVAKWGKKDLHDFLDMARKFFKSPDLQEIRLFSNALVESDFSIHIHKDSSGETSYKSDVGLYIADQMSELGLVQHTVWKEEPSPSQDGSNTHLPLSST